MDAKQRVWYITLLFTLVLVGCQGTQLQGDNIEESVNATPDVDNNVSDESQEEEMLKIGYVGPLSGEFSSVGITEMTAINMAKEAINSEGGINGKNISIVYKDASCNSTKARKLTKDLIGNNWVEVILGTGCDNTVIPSSRVANQRGKLFLSSNPTHPNATKGEYAFRIGRNWKNGAELLATHFQSQNISDVTILTQELEHGIGFEESFKNSFDENVVVERYNEEQGVSSVLQNLENPEVVLVNPVYPNPDKLRKLHGTLASDVPIYGIHAQIPDSFQFEDRSMYSVSGSKIDEETALPVVHEFTQRRNGSPYTTRLLMARYDGVRVLSKAIEDAGYNAENVSASLKNTNYTASLGAYSFDESGEDHRLGWVMTKYSGAGETTIAEIS